MLIIIPVKNSSFLGRQKYKIFVIKPLGVLIIFFDWNDGKIPKCFFIRRLKNQNR